MIALNSNFVCRCFQLLVLCVVLFGLGACGGGGGSSSSAATSALVGVAAVGTPIANGNISVICAAGNSFSTTSSSTGAWQLTLSGQTLPCAVQISGGTINGVANTTNYTSIAMATGTVNVTPLTDLLVANLTGTSNTSAWFAGLSSPSAVLAAITQTQVNTALAKLSAALPALPLSTINPITTSFTPTAGNISDQMLSALQAAITSNTVGVTYASLLVDAAASSFNAPPTGFGTALSAAYNLTYTIGGTVSGLNGTVVLQDNGGDNLVVNANGSITFATTIPIGGSYSLTVLTQPSGQTCVVANGSGNVASANVTLPTISCTNGVLQSYSIGATVSGLTGTGLVLQNNLGNNLSVTANGNVKFTTPLVSGSSYSITVSTQPAGQTCTVTNGSGTVASSNVTIPTVSCSNSGSTLLASNFFRTAIGDTWTYSGTIVTGTTTSTETLTEAISTYSGGIATTGITTSINGGTPSMATVTEYLDSSGNMLSTTNGLTVELLPHSISAGVNWTHSSYAGVVPATIVAMNVSRTVPAGTFSDCVELTFGPIISGSNQTNTTIYTSPTVGRAIEQISVTTGTGGAVLNTFDLQLQAGYIAN